MLDRFDRCEDASGADGDTSTGPLEDTAASKDDVCSWGSCPADRWCEPGTKTVCKPIACKLPTVTPSIAWQVVAIRPLRREQACDLNDDGKGDRGTDSAVEAFGLSLAEDALKAISSGQYTQLLAPAPLPAGGTLVGYTGVPDPEALKKWCKPSQADPNKRCPIRLRKESMILHEPGTCRPATRCRPVTSLKEHLANWRPAKEHSYWDCGDAPQPVIALPQMAIMARRVTMQGAFVKGPGVSILRVCGAFEGKAIEAFIDKAPKRALRKQSLSRDDVKQLVFSLLTGDVDLDGDGKNDAVSFASEIHLRRVNVLGWDSN